MVTVEQIEEALSDDKNPYSERDVDHTFKAISLLRSKIPYEECKNIIGAAEHDKIFICSVEIASKYIDEQDIKVLADCNCWIEYDSIGLFI